MNDFKFSTLFTILKILYYEEIACVYDINMSTTLALTTINNCIDELHKNHFVTLGNAENHRKINYRLTNDGCILFKLLERFEGE